MRVVLDTNVLVRALLTPPNPSRELLDIALEGRDAGLTVLHDGRILAEYRDVLLRPKFEFDSKRVLKIVRRLQHVGERVKIARKPTLPHLSDPKDAPFVEVGAVGKAAVVVTFNPKHFPRTVGFMVVDAVSVIRALDFLRGEDRSR